MASLSLAIPGRHNIRNALAALAAGHWHGIKPAWAATMLRDFTGAGRRFELIGEAGGVVVIDDYAHHPTEIAATLAAARIRYPSRRIWAVFQPHTFSRTQALLGEFARSFDDADQVVLLDIYAAREKIDLGMHSTQLLARMDHPAAHYLGDDPRGRRLFALARRTRRYRDHHECGRWQPGRAASAGRAARPGVGDTVTRRHGDSDVWQFDTSPCHRVVISAPPAFYEAAGALGVTVAADEPLARHTTFHIGGPADLYAVASNIAQLERLAELAAVHAIPLTILGGGSNILVSDAGVRGLVIANQTRKFGMQDAERRIDEFAFRTLTSACCMQIPAWRWPDWPAGPSNRAGRGWSGRSACPARWGAR